MALVNKGVGGDLPPFFKPADHANDLAIIFEPLSVREGIQSRWGLRDCVHTRITVFRTQESLDKGQPTLIQEVEINSFVLAKVLKELLENGRREGDPRPAMIAVVKQHQSKNSGNKAWVFRLPKDEDYDKAAAYYEAREARLQEALKDVPDF